MRLPGHSAAAVVAACLLLASTVEAQFGARPPNRSSLLDEGALHVVLCGSGSPLPSAERAGPCTAVIADGRMFLIDVGPGSTENLRLWGLPVGSLAGVLLTHFHSDHIGELGEVVFASWTSGRAVPLDVYGPAGVDRVVAGFQAAYELDVSYRVAHHGADLLAPDGGKMNAHPIELAEDASSRVFYDEDGLRITAFLVEHEPIAPAVGYRIDYGGRSVVVSGDTVRSANLEAASRGVDVLVHEVLSGALIGGAAQALESAGNERTAKMLRDTLDYHTFPADVHALAADAEVKLLVLSHLVPPLPAAQAEGVFMRGRAADAPNEAVVGVDGMHIALPANSDQRTIETF
jgi:ribonuclease Z